jgi:hypothetical protein
MALAVFVVFACVLTCALLARLAVARHAAVATLALLLPAGAAHAQFERLEPIAQETWHGWESLGGVTQSGADCVTTQVDRIDCFYSTNGGAIMRSYWDGQRWNGPVSLNVGPIGGISLFYLEARPVCLTWAPDHISCFARSGNNPDPALYQQTLGLRRARWSPLGGGLTSDPSCVSSQPQRYDCLARGPNGQLSHNSFNGTAWSGWNPRGGQLLQGANPSCVVFRGEINCIYVNQTTNSLRHIRWPSAGGIDDRDMQGGALQTPGVQFGPKCYVSRDPDLNSGHDDQIHCFAPRITTINPRGVLARWGWNGQGNWSLSDLGENFGSNNDWDCVVRSSQRIDCVELIVRPGVAGATTTVGLRHRVFRLGQGVSINEVNLPGATGAPNFIRCVSWGGDVRLDCFATGNGSPLLHAWLDLTQPVVLQPAQPRQFPPRGG